MSRTTDADHTSTSQVSATSALSEVITNCRCCVAMCGIKVLVDVEQNRAVRVSPDKQNPHTWRDFCANARTAPEMVEHPRRLTSPMKRVDGNYVAATYEEAEADIARRLNEIIDRYGPDAVGTYQGNPAGSSWSNSVSFAGLLDAIGTNNRFWVGSVDQNSFHVVARKLFGLDLPTFPPDIDSSDCLLLIGHNPAESTAVWVWAVPDGWRRMLARRDAGADLIIVDPRRTASAREATVHVAVSAGQDWALLLAMIKVIFERGWDRPASAVPVSGIERIRRLAADADFEDLAARCEVPDDVIVDIARRFALAPRALCATATGVSQTTTGTVGEWLGWVLNLITDRVDKPGGRRFERGPSDVGKVMKLMAPPVDHRTRLRGTSMVAGFHSLAELPDEIMTPGPGQIRAVIVNAANPVVSGPQGAALDKALSQLELLVAVDLVQRESHRHAHWLIPATHWLESTEVNPLFNGLQDGSFIQQWRAAVAPPAGVKDDWEFFVDLALALDRNLFGKPGMNRLVRASREVAQRTGRPGLAFNPDWSSRLLLAIGRRVKWKDLTAAEHGLIYGERRFGDLARALDTQDKTVNVGDPELVEHARRLLGTPRATRPVDYPFTLGNRRRGSGMNSWLNELPSQQRLYARNRVEIHPDDAVALEVCDGELVVVSSPVGSIEVKALVTDAVRRGTVCVDHGWGSRLFDPSGSEQPVILGANRNLLVDNRHVDPLSGTPGFNDTFVAVRPLGGSRTDAGASSV